MTGLLYLSWRHLVHHRRASALLVLALAVTAFLPLATRLVTADFERGLVARADATPLVAGARGNRFDLVLASLYFRENALESLHYGDLDELSESLRDVVIPINARHTARRRPIVATSPDYFRERALAPETGDLPAFLGECVLGSAVLPELSVGETLFSDARGSYDLAGATPTELSIVGRLAPTGGPDDGVIFVSVDTGWMLEGLVHGHGEATELDTSKLMGRTDDHVKVGPALIEIQTPTAENRDSFHLHADEAELPLTAALVFPSSTKARTMMKTRVNAKGELEVVDPRDVVEELLAAVFRVRRLLDLFALLLGGSTLLLGALVILLSVRLRAGELATLERIGASRLVALQLVAFEVSLILATALAVAGAGLAAVRAFFPDVMELLP